MKHPAAHPCSRASSGASLLPSSLPAPGVVSSDPRSPWDSSSGLALAVGAAPGAGFILSEDCPALSQPGKQQRKQQLSPGCPLQVRCWIQGGPEDSGMAPGAPSALDGVLLASRGWEMRICHRSRGRGQWGHPRMMSRACAGSWGDTGQLPLAMCFQLLLFQGFLFPSTECLPAGWDQPGAVPALLEWGWAPSSQGDLFFLLVVLLSMDNNGQEMGMGSVFLPPGAAQPWLRELGGLSPQERRLRRDLSYPSSFLEVGWSRVGIASPM